MAIPDRYLTVPEVETVTANLAEQFPGLVQLLRLPNVTFEGRTSHALHLRTDPSVTKPVLMVIGGIHGCEWGSCEIILNLVRDLAGSLAQQKSLVYGNVVVSAGQVSDLFDAIDLVAFPLVNPDGRLYSQTHGSLWRKNRNPAMYNGIPGSVGVDINRNFDFLFDFDQTFDPAAPISTSSKPEDVVYRGPYPWSEAETRNVKWLVEHFPSVRWFADLHSGARGLLYPWNDDELQDDTPGMNFANPAHHLKRGLAGDGYREFMDADHRDTLVDLANVFGVQAKKVGNRPYGNAGGFSFQPASGTSQDWVFSRHFSTGGPPTFSFTIEWCGDTFTPTWPTMKNIVADVCAGLLGIAVHASGA